MTDDTIEYPVAPMLQHLLRYWMVCRNMQFPRATAKFTLLSHCNFGLHWWHLPNRKFV